MDVNWKVSKKIHFSEGEPLSQSSKWETTNNVSTGTDGHLDEFIYGQFIKL